MRLKTGLITGLSLIMASHSAQALEPIDEKPEWSAPHAPYRISDHVYSVGTQGIGVYLIKGSQGLILLDCSPNAGVAVIEANIKSLGFRLDQVKWILTTHAHEDHVGGCATLRRDSGARFAAGAGDQSIYETGQTHLDNAYRFPDIVPVKLDQALKDGDVISSGRIRMVAMATAGHTPGTLSWTLIDTLKGKSEQIVFFGSTSVAGNVLIDNKSYPDIVSDYRRSFQRLKALRAGIVLGNHTEFFDQEVKFKALKAGKSNAFVDRKALKDFVIASEAAFERALVRQQLQKKAIQP